MLLAATPYMLPAAAFVKERTHPLVGSTETGISQPAVAPCTAACASAQNASSDTIAAARFSDASCSAVASFANRGKAALPPAARIFSDFSAWEVVSAAVVQIHDSRIKHKDTTREEGTRLITL